MGFIKEFHISRLVEFLTTVHEATVLYTVITGLSKLFFQ